MMKKIMTVDCDGVLAASVEAFLQFYDHKILGKSVKIDDLYDHRYHNIPELGLDKPTAIQLRMRFFEEVKLEDFYPEPGALEAMQKLQQQGWKLIVLTGRLTTLRSCTQERIQHYFPGVFHDIVHANDLTPEAVPKGVLAQQLGADRHIDDHIDDHIDYALSTLEYGIPSLLMTKPWNSSFSTKEHESLHRVASRQEALAILENHA